MGKLSSFGAHKIRRLPPTLVQPLFWRTTAHQEVDYLEESDGQLHAFEFKWNTKKNNRITKTFTNAYPDAITAIITPYNYVGFVS